MRPLLGTRSSPHPTSDCGGFGDPCAKWTIVEACFLPLGKAATASAAHRPSASSSQSNPDDRYDADERGEQISAEMTAVNTGERA
jgi:hypothetical protein